MNERAATTPPRERSRDLRAPWRLLSDSFSGRSGWIAAAVGLLVVAFVIPLLRRGITMADEGYLLLQSVDMLGGKVLYRDMDAFVTPGAWLVLAALFKLVEPSVIASRIPVLVGYLAMIGVSYRIVASLTDRRSGLLTAALLMAGTVWAFPAWTFAFYSPYSVMFALAALERLLAWRRLGRNRDLLWCGVLLGLSIIFKQNYGVFAVLGIVAGLVSIRIELRQPAASALRGALADAVRVAGGAALVGLPVVGYFVYQGAFPAMFRSLLIHPFEFSGQHDIPYLYPGELFRHGLLKGGVDMLTYAAQPVYRVPPITRWIREIGLVERLHVILYWAPPVIFIVGASLSVRPAGTELSEHPGRPVDAGLLSTIAMAAALFLGVFPRADFNHLINVYQPVIVAGVVATHELVRNLPNRHPAWLRVALGAGRATVGLFVIVAVYWYFALIHQFDTPVGGKRGGVLVNGPEATRVNYGLEVIEKMSEKGSAVLTLPDLAMFNFLADRPVPSAYYNLYQHHIAHDQGAAVVEGAEAHRVQLAFTRYNNFFSDRVGLRTYAPILAEYLITHFELLFSVGTEDYLVLRKLPQPRPQLDERDLLGDCDLSSGQQIAHTRSHLLFDSLYHNPGTGVEMPRAAVQTECRVRVPAQGAELVVELGYRQPGFIMRRGSLTMEIFAEIDGELRRLFRHAFPVVANIPGRYRFPPLDEFRVDLSAYAGEEVKLVLRTTRTGQVVMDPFDFRGYGTMWQKPRIVATETR
jgi:hypothetical protein